MKAIILAAGQGNRLKPLTKDNPKCMVRLFGKRIIDFQIEVFRKLGIEEIIVITGFKANSVNIPNVKIYHNENFDTTNMVSTLFCAKKELDGEVIVSYGDIVFEISILKELLISKDDFSIVVDKKWKNYWSMRFKDPINDVESLRLDRDEQILDIGKKVTSLDVIQGQYIGLMKFSNLGTEIIKEVYEELKDGKNPLNPKMPFKDAYMTDFLQYLINKGNKLKAILTNNRWLEVDTINDYKLYEELYKTGEIKKFFDPEKFM